MKRRVLSVLLAGLLLLQGTVWAAAEEQISDENEWMAVTAETRTAAGPSEESIVETDVIPDEENLQADGKPAGAGSEMAEIPDAEIPAEVQTPEEESSEGTASEADQAEEGIVLPEEEGSGLTIDAVEEVELSDIGAPSSGIADEAGPVPVDEQHFPDAKFRTYVAGFDTDGDGILSAAEIGAVVSIDVKGKVKGDRISSLIGIEYFTSLQTLDCSVNQLRALDVSKNTALTELNCSINQLAGLDVSRNTSLTVLDCGNNRLTGLDVSQNPELTVLKCGNNGLTSLNVGQNPKLTVLNCTNIQAEELDVSRNPELTELNCGDGRLTTLDVSQNPKLQSLECYNNQLTSLNVSRNPELVTLFCNLNNLTSLDVSTCAKIETLVCGSNRLTQLTVGAGAALTGLYCEDNQLTSLDVSGYSKLRGVDCSRNQITSLTIGYHTGLNSIECQENQLTSLDVNEDIALQNLICSSNQLTALDLTEKGTRKHNKNLSWLDCSDNQLEALDLSGNLGVKQVICENNELTALDVSAHDKLEILNCAGNRIERLNVNGCTNLTGLDCENNRLTSLDVSEDRALLHLFCGFNPLMSLDLSRNADLDELKCDSLEMTLPDCSYRSGTGFPLAERIGEENLSRMVILTEGARLEGGEIKISDPASSEIVYTYSTEASSPASAVGRTITVTLKIPEHEYTTILEASCTQPGSRHRRCTVCGYDEAGEVIPPTGHTYGAPAVEREATCGAAGSLYHECTVCGYRETAGEIPATGLHSYGEYVVVKEATALEEGLETRTCSVCGGTESRAVGRLNARITLNADSILLKKKQSTNKLAVTELEKGDRVVSWKSGNTKLVTVKGTGDLTKCKLTAKNKTGSTDVTVTLASGLEKKIRVTVQKADVATRKITGLEKKMTLTKGEKITLKPVITPITSVQKVTYQSSSEKIVSVSAKGVVRALKAGKAKLTVKSGNKRFVITMNIKKSKK